MKDLSNRKKSPAEEGLDKLDVEAQKFFAEGQAAIGDTAGAAATMRNVDPVAAQGYDQAQVKQQMGAATGGLHADVAARSASVGIGADGPFAKPDDRSGKGIDGGFDLGLNMTPTEQSEDSTQDQLEFDASTRWGRGDLNADDLSNLDLGPTMRSDNDIDIDDVTGTSESDSEPAVNTAVEKSPPSATSDKVADVSASPLAAFAVSEDAVKAATESAAQTLQPADGLDSHKPQEPVNLGDVDDPNFRDAEPDMVPEPIRPSPTAEAATQPNTDVQQRRSTDAPIAAVTEIRDRPSAKRVDAPAPRAAKEASSTADRPPIQPHDSAKPKAPEPKSIMSGRDAKDQRAGRTDKQIAEHLERATGKFLSELVLGLGRGPIRYSVESSGKITGVDILALEAGFIEKGVVKPIYPGGDKDWELQEVPERDPYNPDRWRTEGRVGPSDKVEQAKRAGEAARNDDLVNRLAGGLAGVRSQTPPRLDRPPPAKAQSNERPPKPESAGKQRGSDYNLQRNRPELPKVNRPTDGMHANTNDLPENVVRLNPPTDQPHTGQEKQLDSTGTYDGPSTSTQHPRAAGSGESGRRRTDLTPSPTERGSTRSSASADKPRVPTSTAKQAASARDRASQPMGRERAASILRENGVAPTREKVNDYLKYLKTYNDARGRGRVEESKLEGFEDYAIEDVNIGYLRGSRDADFREADRRTGYSPERRNAEGVVWHHHPELGRMVLIPKDVHALDHHGGVSIWQALTGERYP